MPARIDHAVVETDDPHATAAFYERMLGARIVVEEGRPVKRVAVLVLLAAVAAACGGSSGDAVAHVGKTTITRSELREAVGHFKDEAAAEGRPFPKEGTDGYRTVERQALVLLVYRAELLQSAEKLGVRVSESDVDARMKSAGTESDAGQFARDTVRSQLTYEGVYAKVTSDIAPTRRE
ncbi:MAG: SurA N-terminal domain-containing protein, partial [Actinobacteria bacterium]|nr:SurA N-terminal domain-containing protein [Actinomycetota bacterium]